MLRFACAAAATAFVIATAGAPVAVNAWPFQAKAAAPPATTQASGQASGRAAAKTAPAPPKKATAQERAAADRLDPLARSAFWAREADLDPSDAAAGVELAAALRGLGHFQEASDAVDRVLVLDPKNLAALLESARDHIADNKGFYAIEPLKTAMALAPGDWRAVSLMGVAREQNQQPEEAHAAFLQALRLSPENPAVLSNLALWCATHGDHAQAEALLRRAAAAPNASAQERQNLALLLGMEGRLPDAERLMREDLPPEVANNNLAYLRAVSSVAR